jgi:hypothetical protein
MDTNYTVAIASVFALVVVLTGMVTFVLTRPTEPFPNQR